MARTMVVVGQRSKLVKCLECFTKFQFKYYPEKMTEPLAYQRLLNLERLGYVFVDTCPVCKSIANIQIIEA